MDEQQNQLGSSQNNQPQFGAPPPPQVGLRTMQSDIKSVERGEPTPIPESVLPPENTSEPVFRPETQLGETSPKEGGKKKALGLVVTLLVLVILGLGGYFAYPIFFGAEAPPPAPPPAPVPIISVTPHNSFFFPAAPSISEIRLSTLLGPSITNALQALSANRLADSTLQEVSILDAEGSQTAFSSFFPALAPTVPASQLPQWFEDDFTAFLFYDQDGVWPGYAAKVKNGVNVDDVKSAFASLEAADLSAFYLTPPGVFGTFKSGQINGKATRYAVGSTPGASFNYGFVSGYLVVSTSYNGLKSAASLLGI